jgi:4,4'-diaponeurosporenoate glycosyltransferase
MVISGSSWALLFAALTLSTVVVARIPVLPRSGGLADDVLVVIPARNEAAVLGPLIDDLAAQTALPARVVIIDDHSEDDTSATALAHAAQWPMLRVEVRSSAEVAPSWNPKSWALHQGVVGNEARLLFLDADVRLAPDAVAALSAAHHRTGGLLSVAPNHHVGSLIESLSLPFNLVAAMGASGSMRRMRGKSRAAFGPCLMSSRCDYEHVGGHQSVHDDLLDDVALAQRYRHHGRSTWLFLGGSLVRYRMYPTGFRALLDGWTKNIASGATRTAPLTAFIVGLWVTAQLLPLWWLVGGGDQRAALLAWLLVGVHTAVLARRVGRFGLVAVVATPLLALFFAAVTVRSSLLLIARQPVRWKGRRLTAPHRSAWHG